MEYRMKCDVCGNIFCYTDEDLKKNEDNAKMARINALGGVFSAMGGTPMQTHHMTGQANLHSSKIVDYTQCPHCHSRSISVYTGDDTEKASPSVAVAAKSINTSASAESLLKRAFIFLEDEEWETADAYCEACLDKDPELAEAYLGKLMAELHVKTQTGLKDLAKPFDDNANYKKTVRFGNDELKNTLCKYLELIHNRNEAARKDDILYRAKSKMAGNTISQCQEAISLLVSIAGWKDADEQKAVCYQKIEELGKKAEEEKIKNARFAEIKQKQAAEQAKIKAAANAKKMKIFAIIAAAIILLLISTIISSRQTPSFVGVWESVEDNIVITLNSDASKDSSNNVIEDNIILVLKKNHTGSISDLDTTMEFSWEDSKTSNMLTISSVINGREETGDLEYTLNGDSLVIWGITFNRVSK